MIYDTKRFQEIMTKLNLTPNQIYFCVLLLEQDFNRKRKLFLDYAEAHEGFRINEIEDLENKGYIVNFSDSNVPKTTAAIQTKKGELVFERVKDVIILEMVMVTPKFKDAIYVDGEAAADELLKAYPTWIKIKDRATGKITKVSVKSVPDRDEFVLFYANIINGDIIKHKLIVEMATHLKKFVERGDVMASNIRKALESRFWEQIEELVEADEGEGDIIRMI
jgi:hypothetical protein